MQNIPGSTPGKSSVPNSVYGVEWHTKTAVWSPLQGHILLLEHHHETRDALAVILRREGHIVWTVASEEEALDHLQRQQVDVLLCNLPMSPTSSRAMLCYGKAAEAGVVLVIMIAPHDPWVAVDAMQHGAFDYLHKPFRKDEVVHAVQKAMTVRALLRENLELRHLVSATGRAPR
jgi:DNA-binding NtrC family response regulator